MKQIPDPVSVEEFSLTKPLVQQLFKTTENIEHYTFRKLRSNPSVNSSQMPINK